MASFFDSCDTYFMIKEWITNFKDGWLSLDIDSVLSLFSDDVEYWETPFKRIESKKHLKEEWKAILKQKDINLKLEEIQSTNDFCVVLWYLDYLDESSQRQKWAGTYVIKLNNKGLCIYFHQTGEKK